MYFKEKDFFKEKLSITYSSVSKEAKYLSSISLKHQIFPIENWDFEMLVDEELILSSIEFLYDHISKPREMEEFVTDTGFNYNDYGSYDTKAGQKEFREAVNQYLSDFKDGYELDEIGEIIRLGDNGLEFIVGAELPEYDFDNIELHVEQALHIWRQRDASKEDKKDAVRKLCDVLEWLRKSDKLTGVLNKKDENDLFQIANQFAIRHHNPRQKSDYDEDIWYSWMFHFYLATYHAIIRMIKKKSN
ncbi:MAG: hypothetical protein ABJN07_14880 [Balneola sp.]